MRDHRPVDCRFRLSDEGKPYMTPWCPACEQTAVVTPGARCHLDVGDVEPEWFETLQTEIEQLNERLRTSQARTVLLEKERKKLIADLNQLRAEVAQSREFLATARDKDRSTVKHPTDLISFRESVDAYRRAAFSSLTGSTNRN